MADMLAFMKKVNAQPTTMGRRNVLAAGAVGVGAAGLLVACGSDDEPAASTPGPQETGAAPSASAPSASASGGAAAPANALASTSDIPVGGGKIFPERQVVVTQPAAGDFKAFNAQCTHQGCQVSQVQGAEIHCTCHGSIFSATDGSVLGGPAPSPLAAQAITVEGESIVLG
ncbi:Rieske (2Fe-2S) protein [Phytohabitans houttuyneae]|uniref:Cytochrome bc1 complex Rieske iron-sulfur subunit n=1 Tax=Phytohabitans houttuyneae TaxID=1076126 RepID=A0A6V8KM18_9ACTN|nr:Rieske (2Fe-2S) protein [Phytohabitans houttuyneae]GFJ86183.1 iron-sulfur protein [Phytohabitans houttuyneae]